MRGQTRHYSAKRERGPLQSHGLQYLIGMFKAMLKEIEPSTKCCAVCELPRHRKEQRLANTNHQQACALLGRDEARRLLKERRSLGLRKGPKVKMVREVEVYYRPIILRLYVEDRPIVVSVCSEECREQVLSGQREYNECLIRLHESWQQVRAIRTFLRTKNHDVLQLLRPGLGPASNSRASCPRS